MPQATLTQTIPLFPLGTTLFPGGVLPLKIFEVRYLDMVKKCFKEGSCFGIATIAAGSEVRMPGQAVQLLPIGTLAKIMHFDALQPALYFIQCEGQSRFRILESTVQLTASATTLGKVIRALQEQGVSQEEMPFKQPFRLDECGWVANRWAELLPLTPLQKQQLLLQENPRLRLDLVNDFLDQEGVR
jgi:Lon protease-like protein